MVSGVTLIRKLQRVCYSCPRYNQRLVSTCCNHVLTLLEFGDQNLQDPTQGYTFLLSIEQMNPLLHKLLLLMLSLGLLFSDNLLKLLLLYICVRTYSRSTSTLTFATEVLKGESGFTFLYTIWLIYHGRYLIQYFPLLLFCCLMWMQVTQQNSMVPSIDRNKQTREEVFLLKNKLDILLLVYQVCSTLGNSGVILRSLQLAMLVKFKYGFNVYMQRVFHQWHMRCLGLVVHVAPLLFLYRMVHTGLSSLGSVYIARRGGNKTS